VLEDLLDLLALSAVYPGRIPDSLLALLRNNISKMVRWLEVMTPPSGDVARFNDSSPGVALSLQDLSILAKKFFLGGRGVVAPGITLLAHSGYARIAFGPFTGLIDVGEIGASYNPGHAHADTLSFELWMEATPILQNSGTSVYGQSPQRHFERSTFAHNCVVLDKTNSSEVWSGFRVADRALPTGLRLADNGTEGWIECAHTGYKRLPGKPIHLRRLAVRPNEVEWVDTLIGGALHEIEGIIPFAPGISILSSPGPIYRIVLPNGKILFLRIEGATEIRLDDGTFAPEFGKLVKRHVVVWRVRALLPVSVRITLKLE
jgi:uncharacterized heparinase superfamily protein